MRVGVGRMVVASRFRCSHFLFFLNSEDFLREGVENNESMGGHEAKVLGAVVNLAPELC